MQIVAAWKTSFVGVSSEFELIFSRFETLASLAYFEENSEESLEQAYKNQPQQPFCPMPVGRSGWSRSSTEDLIKELQSEVTITSLLQAGFAKNSRRCLELFVENFKRHAHIMQW